MRAVAHGPADAPAVLVAHGFKGFKDWGMFPWICERVAEAGLRAIRFDFSHNGVEEHDFDRLDLFLLDTPTRHQEDLCALAAAVPGPLGLLGHSRGGGDVILFAASEPRVRCVATLASVSSTVLGLPDQERTLREKGYYPIPNARTKQLMPVARHAFEDGRRYDLAEEASRLGVPLLLVHGDADESVPVAAQTRLREAQPAADVLTIQDAGHTFGAVHPFAGPTRASGGRDGPDSPVLSRAPRRGGSRRIGSPLRTPLGGEVAMRMTVLGLALVLVLGVAACGDKGGETSDPGPAGTWVVDNAQFLKDLTANFKETKGMDLPAQAAAMAKASQVDFTIEADGTWTAKGTVMGKPIEESGTWTQKGEKLTVTRTRKHGKELATPETFEGDYDGTTIMAKPDKGMPFQLRMVRK